MTHYYLRPCDFLPEELDELAYKELGFPSKERAEAYLADAGNLFSSREDAARASILVKNLFQQLTAISKAQQECSQPCQKLLDNIVRHSHSSEPRTQIAETTTFDDEPQSPNERSAFGRKDNSSRANAWKTQARMTP